MHRGSTTWRARGLGVALSACALAVAACGGSDDSPDGPARAAVQVGSPSDNKAGNDPAQAALPERGQEPPGNGAKSKRSADSSDAAVLPRAAVPANPAAPTAQAPKPSDSRPEAKAPKPPRGTQKPGKVKPPPFLPGGGGDPYEVARNLCGDRQLVELVPPEYRGSAEEMARMYADFYDSGNKQQAYEGCLAGLRSLGY